MTLTRKDAPASAAVRLPHPAPEAGYYSVRLGPPGDDYTGLAAIPAALVVFGAGAATLWRSRRLDDRLLWWYVRRALLALAAVGVGFLIVYPIGLAYFVTHVWRAVVPAAQLGPTREAVSFTTSDRLTLRGWYVPSRNKAAVIVSPGEAA